MILAMNDKIYLMLFLRKSISALESLGGLITNIDQSCNPVFKSVQARDEINLKNIEAKFIRNFEIIHINRLN